jgi:dihydroxyacetone kinase-like predicted kinase
MAAGFFMLGGYMTDSPQEISEMSWRQRIERKLDEVVAALSAIKQIEVQIASESTNIKRAHVRLDGHELRIRDLEISGAGERNKTSSNEWAVRLIVSTVFGLIVGVTVYLLK